MQDSNNISNCKIIILALAMPQTPNFLRFFAKYVPQEAVEAFLSLAYAVTSVG